MNPNFLNLFMKKLTRERVVPRESLSTISDGLNKQTVLARFLPVHLSFLGFGGWTANLLSAVHQLAWTQHPAIWLCESCAILWLVVRAVRSPWVRAGVLLVLCGLMLNGLVTAANAGTMPVVGLPSTLHPVSPMWRLRHRKRGCCSQTKLG